MHHGSPLLPVLAHGVTASTVIPLPHYTSYLLLVCPALALHLFLFRLQHLSSHTILIQFLHVSKPSQHSLVHSTRQLTFYSNSTTNHYVCISIRVTPTILLLFISKTSTLLYALLIPHTMPLAQHSFIQTFFCIYTQYSIAQHTFQRSPRLMPLIRSVYEIVFTFFIRCHLRPQVLKAIYFRLKTFSLTCIRPTFTCLEHFITLLLPTFGRNFLLSYTRSSSLFRLHNFSSDIIGVASLRWMYSGRSPSESPQLLCFALSPAAWSSKPWLLLRCPRERSNVLYIGSGPARPGR